MKYLAKKLAGFVMTMLVVSFLVFAAFAVIPGDPATAMLGTQATPEKLAALREQMGLNEPLLVRFGSWAVNFIQGDFGTSYKYQMSVRGGHRRQKTARRAGFCKRTAGRGGTRAGGAVCRA